MSRDPKKKPKQTNTNSHHILYELSETLLSGKEHVIVIITPGINPRYFPSEVSVFFTRPWFRLS